MAGPVRFDSAAAPVEPEGVHPRAALPTQANRFAAEQVQPGDTVAGLTVERVDLRQVPDQPGVYVGSVAFEGALDLRGRYGPNPGWPETELTCFYPEPLSAARLPRMAHDARRVWLCFSNADRAHELLGPPGESGGAAIRVQRYTTVYEFTDAFDTAELAEVLEREPT